MILFLLSRLEVYFWVWVDEEGSKKYQNAIMMHRFAKVIIIKFYIFLQLTGYFHGFGRDENGDENEIIILLHYKGSLSLTSKNHNFTYFNTYHLGGSHHHRVMGET